MDERAIIQRVAQAAPGRRATALLRILQAIAPGASRLRLGYLLRKAVPVIPLQVLKACAGWQGVGGSMSDAAVDAELAPFLPPAPFDPAPCPHPWTAGQPGTPTLPGGFLDALRAGADPDTCGVIADWLEQRGDAGSAALRGASRWGRRAGADATGLFAEAQVGEVTLRLRWVTPGRFQMGNDEGDAALHTVTLTRGFWIAEAPVTQALWRAVGSGPDPSRFKSADRPAHGVSWDQARAFCAALSEHLPGARLPTEAEWECAARAGTATDTWVDDVILDPEQPNTLAVLDPIAWYSGNCGVGYDLEDGHDLSAWRGVQHPAPLGGVRRVGQKIPNPLGLFDMIGNVSEWCQDRYGQYPGDGVDPTGPVEGERRVHRGGMWCRAMMHAASRAHGWPAVVHRDGYYATAVRVVI